MIKHYNQIYERVTFINKADFEKYLENDYVLNLVLPKDQDEMAQLLGCNQWLIDSAPKRFIFDKVYGDLLYRQDSTDRLKILDIGGGINLAQKLISKGHDLTVVDLLAHDDLKAANEYSERHGFNLINDDWYNLTHEIDSYDLIISTDLFPNVDQRLFEFLSRVEAKSKSLRLVLTFYQNPRFYNVKRLDADETMCMRAWDGSNVANALLASKVINDPLLLENIRTFSESIFPNGRSVIYVELGRLK